MNFKQTQYFYSGALSTALRQLNRPQYFEVHRRLDFYVGEYKKNKCDYDEISVAASFNDLVQKEIDTELKSDLAKDIACRKGCNHCCHVLVMITDDEAKLLVQFSNENDIKIDWDRLSRQAMITDDVEYIRADVNTKRCVFTDDSGACKVYEHRPASCRKLHVLGDAIQCDTSNNPGGQVKWFISMQAEIITSAMFNATKNGSMASMLIENRNYKQP